MGRAMGFGSEPTYSTHVVRQQRIRARAGGGGVVVGLCRNGCCGILFWVTCEVGDAGRAPVGRVRECELQTTGDEVIGCDRSAPCIPSSRASATSHFLNEANDCGAEPSSIISASSRDEPET